MASSRSADNQNETTPAKTCPSVSSTLFRFFTRTIAPLIAPVDKSMPFLPDAYLGGDPYLGKLSELFSKDGLGFDRIVQAAYALSKTNPHGIGWWRFSPSKVVALITHPDDIKTIVIKNKENLFLHDSTGSFEMFFGSDSIFNTPFHSPRYMPLRKKFRSYLFNGDLLKEDVNIIQEIMRSHLQRIKQNNNVIFDMESFTSSIAMDVISISKLGIRHISDAKKLKISELIGKAVVEINNPWEQVLSQYVPLYKRLANKKFFYTYISKSKLHALLDEGFDLLRELVRENEQSIRAGKNWLNPEGDPNCDLSSQAIIYSITQFLVAGHETTAKSILLELLLAADSANAAVLAKLRKAITDCGVPVDQWSGDSMPDIPYLEAFVLEVLRLYPPIPDMIFKASNAFSIPNGKFKAQDLAIISARCTHRLREVWGDDADEFNPERFLEMHEGVQRVKKVDACTFFPFGFMPRECVGQLIALLESKIVLANIVDKFDIRCEVKNTSGQWEEIHHPFAYNQIFTLHLQLKNIRMKFSPRVAVDLENESKADFVPEFRVMRHN